MRRACFFLCALALACSPQETSLWIPLPPVEGHKSLVIAGPQQHVLHLESFDLTKGTADLKITTDVEGETDALLYPSTLDELEMPSGILEKASTPDEEATLPNAESVYRADAATASWVKVDAPARELGEFRFTAPLHCAAFGRPAAQTIMANERWSMRIDDESVLAATLGGATLLVDRDQVTQLNWGGIPLCALRLPGDEVLLGGFDGRVYRAHVSHASGITDAVPWGGELDPPYQVTSLAGTVYEDGSFEFFAITGLESRTEGPRGDEFVTNMPQLFTNTGSGWTGLGALASDTVGNLVHAGPGEVLIRSLSTGTILQVKDGRPSQSFLGTEVQLTSLDLVEGTGPVAGSGQGLLYARAGNDDWRPLSDYAYGWWVLSAIGYGRGVLFLLASGSIVELDARHRHCPETGSVGASVRGEVFGLSEREVFVSGVNGGVTTFLFVPRE